VLVGASVLIAMGFLLGSVSVGLAIGHF
jgi:hypothetical protein